MAETKIHDVQSLEKAIAELELKRKLLEQKLDSNGEHLQKNFVSMVFKSVIPTNSFETGPIAAAGNFLKSDKLKDGFTRLVNSVSDLASEGVETIVNKFKGKKDKHF
ncbi:MAG TPA: hypothetical protein VK625_06775 [Flavitalea sp.]|nr:hypothetical protein [Flavitalea sp.]